MQTTKGSEVALVNNSFGFHQIVDWRNLDYVGVLLAKFLIHQTQINKDGTAQIGSSS